MDVIRLRTLTRKSKIGWGMYKDRTVQEMIGSYKKQLAWLYYNVEWMTFTQDILDELGIKGKWCIEKPGVDKKSYEARLRHILDFKYGDKVKFVMYNRKKRRQAKELLKAEEESISSKARMMAYNHGHISHL